MSASVTAQEKLIKLSKKQLNAIKNAVDCFDNVNLRKKYYKEYENLGYVMGDIVCDESIVGKNFDPDDYLSSNPRIQEITEEIYDLFEKYHEMVLDEESKKCKKPRPDSYEEVTDSFEIEGDIVITDPCYLENQVKTTPTHTRGTIYGDWGCSVWTFNPQEVDKPNYTNEPTGVFCADSGKVCVTALSKDEIKKLKKWKPSEWCVTIIEGFKGKVQYIELVEFIPVGGEWQENRSLLLRGKGTKNGEPFAFETCQTSL